MTPRMTVALAVLTLGLALAALAGIPALIENRTVGDVVVILGFSVAVAGAALVAFAVPEQRRETKKLKKSDTVAIAKLRAERRRLRSIREQTETALRAANTRMALRPISASISVGPADPSVTTRAEIGTLTTALIELDAALEDNAAEFLRYGINNPDAEGSAAPPA